MKARRALAAIALGLTIAGCATLAPYQAMSDARQAIDAAEPVVAGDDGARSLLDESREHLKAAEAYLEEGDHEGAHDHARRARELAIEAREDAGAGSTRGAP